MSSTLSSGSVGGTATNLPNLIAAHDAPEGPPPPRSLARTLLYSSGHDYCTLPKWAKWFIDLGAGIVPAQQHLESGHRLVVGVSVPARAYAAALAAAGAVAALYRYWSPDDMASHFEKLSRLPAGTYVTYRDGNYVKCGTLDGIDEMYGDLWVRISDGAYRRRWDRCGEIHPLGRGEPPFPGKKRLSEAGEFVRSAVGVSGGDYAMCSSVDCLLVGPKADLLEELTGERFAATKTTGKGKPPTGTLQDILRCRAVGGAAASLYRSDILAAYAADRPKRLASCKPAALILDGASAYLRWRADFPDSPVLAIFDRSAAGSEAASYAFAADRARSVRDLDIPLSHSIPSGVEILAFEEEPPCA